MNERRRALAERGVDVISFGIGESDLGTPGNVSAAVHAAVDGDRLTCTPPSGTNELRDAVAAWLARDYGVSLKRDHVLVAPGSKYGLYALFLSLLDPGDEMIIPVPAWPTIAGLVSAVGAKPILVPCEGAQGFAPPLDALKRAVTPKTRALYIANPGNPTGVILPAETLEPIVRLCAEHDLLLISDSAYRSHCYEGVVPNVPALAEKHGVAYAIVETLSKRYSMSGWRVGFIATHPDLVAQMADFQAQTLSCPPVIAQSAALAAVTGPQDAVEDGITQYAARRQAMLGAIAKIPRFRLHPIPTGAFFAFPDVKATLGARAPDHSTIHDDTALANYILDNAHCAVIPGSVFGTPGYLRLSYTLPQARIVEGMERIRAAMAALV